jgi:methyl-accepting chemotaxis protein
MQDTAHRKVVRRKYFVPREIRVSIALLVLWSFLSVALFMYAVRELRGVFGDYGILTLIAVVAGYVLIVTTLTVVFSSRLLGPFKRLNAEINTVISGDFNRRLQIRRKDDMTVRTFVDQVNKIIEKLETTRRQSEWCMVHVVSDLSRILSRYERNELSEEALREHLTALHKEVCTFMEERKHRP